MASRLLHRLRRSIFKDGPETVLEQEQEEAETREDDCDCEAELEEEEECVTDRLGGTLCFDSRDGGTDDGGEGDRSGQDSDSDFLGESMEEGLSSTGEPAPRPSLAASALQRVLKSAPLTARSGPLAPSTRLSLSAADTSPVGVSPVGPSSLLTRQLQDSWRRLSGVSGASSSPTGRRLTDSLLFEVTDASVVQDGSSKYVVSSSSLWKRVEA